METRLIIFSPFPPPFPKKHRKPSIFFCSSVSPNPNNDGSNSKEPNSPTNLTTIRYRARSRRQMEKQKKQEEEEEGLQKREAKAPKKKWEEMSFSEKALETYLGEKGLLFWLNKLAYASIFAVIGGWILFRFVGPSVGLYQLDSAPLSPTAIFKNS